MSFLSHVPPFEFHESYLSSSPILNLPNISGPGGGAEARLDRYRSSDAVKTVNTNCRAHHLVECISVLSDRLRENYMCTGSRPLYHLNAPDFEVYFLQGGDYHLEISCALFGTCPSRI